MKKIFLLCLPLAVVAICAFTSGAIFPKPVTVLNHIAVHVTDLKNSSRFYEEVLQLDSIPEPFHDGRHTWLNIGTGSHLHLISGAEKTAVHDKNSHLCFSTSSIQNIIDKLDNGHIPYENWLGAKSSVTTRVDGVKQIYFQDPDGNWLEVNDDFK